MASPVIPVNISYSIASSGSLADVAGGARSRRGVVIENRVRRQQGRVAFTAEVAALKAAGVPEFLGSCYSLLRVRSLVIRKGVCEAVQAFADGRPRLREVY